MFIVPPVFINYLVFLSPVFPCLQRPVLYIILVRVLCYVFMFLSVLWFSLVGLFSLKTFVGVSHFSSFHVVAAIMTEYLTKTVSGDLSPRFFQLFKVVLFPVFFPPWHGSRRSLFRPSPQRVSVGTTWGTAGRSSVKSASRSSVKPTGCGSLKPAGRSSVKSVGRSSVKPPAAAHSSLPAAAHSSSPATPKSSLWAAAPSSPPAAAPSSPPAGRSDVNPAGCGSLQPLTKSPVQAPAPDQESSAGSSPRPESSHVS